MLLAVALGLGATAATHAAGTLSPKGSPHQPIEIRDHHVDVVINNGFARTEVVQTFFNPNDEGLEAVYSFPVPRDASLSEVTIFMSERELHGEVLPEKKARDVYEKQRSKGKEAGLTEKNSYKTFEFRVTPVRAGQETRIRFVYYQPLTLDTGTGRYVYGVEDGGTDVQAQRFWTTNDKVQGVFSIDLELKSAHPVTGVRMPGYEGSAEVKQKAEGHYSVRLEREGARLNRDFVFYYKLKDGLPGRVEMLAYRPDKAKPGTFMMVLTPGVDLKPLTGGSDYLFVLDVSGSMDGGKIRKLAEGVKRALGRLSGKDRFRIVLFNERARDMSGGWRSATGENVQRAIGRVQSLSADGSTNLYAGLKMGLSDLDDDRATSVVLVTDAVTNTGVVEPKAFHELMKRYDVRVFGFLMGNSANWPLMRTVCETSGGFYEAVSNADDLVGRIMLAKSKITHEALHDAELTIDGVEVFGTTDLAIGKIYRGEQLVIFGRYEEPGKATVELDATLTGEDRTFSTTFAFPEVTKSHPELERLWALNRAQQIQQRMRIGELPSSEGRSAIQDLGVEYQIVTDYTSMLVLSDEAFKREGIDRRNQRRIAAERAAAKRRSGEPVAQRRVDQGQPMFDKSAPRGSGSGGAGAFGPVSGIVLLGGAGGLAALARRGRRGGRGQRGREDV